MSMVLVYCLYFRIVVVFVFLSVGVCLNLLDEFDLYWCVASTGEVDDYSAP